MPCSVHKQIFPLVLPYFAAKIVAVLTAAGRSPVVAAAECGAEMDGVLGFGSAKGVVLENHHHLHPLLEIVQCQAYQTLTYFWVVQNDKGVPVVVVVVVVPVCLSNPVEKLKN